MYRGYPNLELLAYQARETVHKKYAAEYEKAQFVNCYADVFMQTWTDTSTGLRTSEYELAGQAITEAYTTVITVCLQNLQNGALVGKKYYVVFFDNKPAYLVDSPTPEFFEDLKNRNLVSKLEAETRY